MARKDDRPWEQVPRRARERGADEIRARIAELEEERFRLTFRSATEALESPLRLRSLRKDIARLKTVLREQELAAAKG
jgi:large subunit ribosomal protein L29